MSNNDSRALNKIQFPWRPSALLSMGVVQLQLLNAATSAPSFLAFARNQEAGIEVLQLLVMVTSTTRRNYCASSLRAQCIHEWLWEGGHVIYI
jgi:hypothetical protein|eukprot:COSAG01_NODE_4459_length_5004_cov_24.561060_7_plen_93_part_00